MERRPLIWALPISVSVVRSVIRQALAYASEDISQQVRFKVGFLANTFIPGFINLSLFATIFFGFFKSGAPSSGGLTQTNFVAFTIIGTLASTLFTQGLSGIQGRFTLEKYWQTALAILASPMSPWALLLGVGLADMVRFGTVTLVFIAAAFLLFPVGPGVVVLTIPLLALLYIVVSGFSLIRGALFLVNENYDPFFSYLILGTAYVSCFYYPFNFLPSFFQPLALVNPIYFVVYLLRALWLGLPTNLDYLLVSLITAVASPLLGTYVFRRVWRNLDLTGY